MTSAKKQTGIEAVLNSIVDHLPSPKDYSKDPDGPFYGRIVDSWFDEHRGVVCLVQVCYWEVGREREGGRMDGGEGASRTTIVYPPVVYPIPHMYDIHC